MLLLPPHAAATATSHGCYCCRWLATIHEDWSRRMVFWLAITWLLLLVLCTGLLVGLLVPWPGKNHNAPSFTQNFTLIQVGDGMGQVISL